MQRLKPAFPAFMLAVTLIIWASFLVSSRAAVSQHLGPVEVGLLRFVPATILFLPVLFRHGPVPRGTGVLDILLLGVVGGFMFVFLLSSGLAFAPVADSGVFTPSTLPLWVAVLAAVFLAEKFTPARLLGFALILFGAIAVGGYEILRAPDQGQWRGHLMFLGGAFCWAVYTVRFRASGLSALPASAMMVFWAAISFGLLGLFCGVDFGQTPPRAIIIQVILQGVFSGFLSTLAYLYCVRHFGAAKTAAFGALVPVIATLGAWVFLGESITMFKGIGILIVCTGVALASGAVGQRRRQQPAHG